MPLQKSIYLVLILMLNLSSGHVLGQRVIVNSKGEKVIMFPDGSWRPFAQGDSLLLRQYAPSTSSAYPQSSKEMDRNTRNKGEEQAYLLQRWNETYSMILLEYKKVQDSFRNATNAQFKAGEQLQNAEENKKIIEPVVLARLQDEYDKSISHLRKAKFQQKKLKKVGDSAGKIHSNLHRLQEKDLIKINASYGQYLAEFYPRTKAPAEMILQNSSAPAPPKSGTPATSKPTTAVPQASTVKSSRNDIPVHSIIPRHRTPAPYRNNPYECVFERTTKDESTGRTVSLLAFEVIFTHTDPDLRPYFRNKELITCVGALSKAGAYIYLNLEFRIASSHAQSNFGSLAGGSLLRLKLLDGEYVSLYNLKPNRGRIDPYSGNTVFSGQYSLGKEDIKKLMRSEVDKVRVLWETGYEDYEVLHLDEIRNQLHCLGFKK